jgi:hypothetical protein
VGGGPRPGCDFPLKSRSCVHHSIPASFASLVASHGLTMSFP